MSEIVVLEQGKGGTYFAGASCVMGVFDGFHRGHQFMIDQALATRQPGGKVLAITFDIDPDELFAANRLKKLMSNEDRLAALANSGVDAVMVLPFTYEFAAQTPAEFLEAVFGEGAPAALHVGADFGFGARNAGHVSDLKVWGEPRGMAIYGHDLMQFDGGAVSATRIRGLLAAGEVQAAERLLGHPYVISGKVVHGRGEGKAFGFPTANLDVPRNRICLADGVYGCQCTIDGTTYNAMVCVGIPPTFADAKQQVEANILDFDGDIYDTVLELRVIQFIRPNRVMSGVDELRAELAANGATIAETQPIPYI